MTSLRHMLFEAIARSTASLDDAADEGRFQSSLATTLRDCQRELPAAFAPALLPPKRPPQSAISALAAGNPPKILSANGKDPCAARAKLDILWHVPDWDVPIELKYCSKRESDVYGYQFMKDLHRLERIISAGSCSTLAETRFAVFVTRVPVYWHGGRPEPEPFWLTDQRVIKPGYWVQYNQTSPDTLWWSYPPFFLTNSYRFQWTKLHRDWKCLLVEVQPQGASVGR